MNWAEFWAKPAWPPPVQRSVLASVGPTTYSTGWSASCACQTDWATYAIEDQAREAAHTFAVRCPLAKRRLAHHRHPREVA